MNYSDLAVDFISSYKKIRKFCVRRVFIDSERSRVLGKREGKYVTIEFPYVNRKLVRVICDELSSFIHGKCLIVGLGNNDSTPDSLGPRVIRGIDVSDGIYVISPGVMGSSGIESFDYVRGICEVTRPDMVIVIDALCSSNINRVNHTIQITDAGICPGSGVGNNRKEISYSSLGIPVISIGIPTVVPVSCIICDCLRLIMDRDRDYLFLSSYLSDLRSLASDVLEENGYDLVVSPKEEDFILSDLVRVLCDSLNMFFSKRG